jgi:carboxypeptidase Q
MLLPAIGMLLAITSTSVDDRTDALRRAGLRELGAFSILQDLTSRIGARPAGPPAAARAVEWGKETMNRLGFQNVHLVECMVPHWVRGREEALLVAPGSSQERLSMCALGMSPATPDQGLTAEVIEVPSVDAIKNLGNRAIGKIVFINQGFDPTLVSTFAQYGGAVGARISGPAEAAKLGAAAVLVRSMTTEPDDVPHTGTTAFGDGPKIPAAALSVVAADRLSATLQKGPASVKLTMTCRLLPDEPSADVVGEIVGTERPDDVIVMGGHLDSWDKGRGASDDGAGLAHSLEALHLIQELGWKPKRTIRVVLFMDEENLGRGAEAYKAYAAKSLDHHLAAIESDAGGFAPRSMACSLPAAVVSKMDAWQTALSTFECDKLTGGGGGGADVSPLAALGAATFGLNPESQRYFDYHHSDKDTIDKVNPRELELGAMTMAMLAWLISEEGLPKS